MSDMRRREFVTLLGGAAVAWPLGALAQKEPARIGFLGSGAAESSVIFVDAFRQGLRDHGLVEGRDYVIDLRFAEGDYARFSTFATELVHRKAAVIVVTTIRAAQEAKRATSTIPIVMTSLIDPVGQGLIASLARPGGNITGLANLADDVMPKLVEILNTVLPTANVIAILFNPANPANRKVVENTALQAKSIGVKLSPVEFKGRDQLPHTFSLLMRQPPSALVVMSDAAITTAVKTKFLADTSISGLKIDVDTMDGVVTLNGDVASKAEVDRAVSVARETDGVKRVVNKLRVQR